MMFLYGVRLLVCFCGINLMFVLCFFFKQKTAYEMRISDWSSDVCSSDLIARHLARHGFVSRVVPVRGGLEAEGDALVTAARHGGAAMLALGAYGHSRLRDLLGGAPLPLLFSH